MPGQQDRVFVHLPVCTSWSSTAALASAVAASAHLLSARLGVAVDVGMARARLGGGRSSLDLGLDPGILGLNLRNALRPGRLDLGYGLLRVRIGVSMDQGQG